MLRFVTKADVWSLKNPTAIAFADHRKPRWQTKTFQDAMAMEYLADVRGQHVGEVGGGASRLLPEFVRQDNTCFNIDRFDGAHGTGIGPDRIPQMAGVTPIVGLVGEPLDWPPESFDVLFSISVMEHIPTEALPAYFADCERMLRPGGRMLHFIDVYIGDVPDKWGRDRLAAYSEPFKTWLRPAGEVLSQSDYRFSTAYATNPDPAMHWWNELAPALAASRTKMQACSLIMDGHKA